MVQDRFWGLDKDDYHSLSDLLYKYCIYFLQPCPYQSLPAQSLPVPTSPVPTSPVPTSPVPTSPVPTNHYQPSPYQPSSWWLCHWTIGPVWEKSGQVRVFNVHIQSKLVWYMPVTGQFLCLGQGKKGGRNKGWGGTACTGGYKGVQTVWPRLVAGGGYLGCNVIWNVPLD